MGHARLHGARAGQDLGDEDVGLAELDTDDSHPRDQAVVHDFEGLDALAQRLYGQAVDDFVLALDQRRRDVLHQGAGPSKDLDVAGDLFGALEILLDLLADGFESADNGLGISVGYDPLPRQHAGVGDRTGDVLTV